jgi:predicted NAD-dependent protein-ADP-ribosyltransferase YbiA (DUF1768 family)
MDIKSGCGYPAAALSNFAPHPFIFDGVQCASFEGLLQSFKFEKVHIQVEVCKLVGFNAKKRGKMKNWQERQVLHWNGVEYPRKSEAYQELLDRAYKAMCDGNEGFRKALLATGDAVLQHSIGRSKQSETVLTKTEFCSRLMKLRKQLKDEQSGVLAF